MADKTIDWLHRVRAEKPSAPWFALLLDRVQPLAAPRAAASGSEKYRAKFDEGWDVMREKTLARQKELGVVPADTELPPRTTRSRSGTR